MRNFEERKAEIFRRSEERISLRKRRQKQLLGIGVPLVCAAVCLAVLLPRQADSASMDQLYTDEAAADAVPAEEKMEATGAEAVAESGHDCTGPCDCLQEDAYVEWEPSAAKMAELQVDEVGKYGSEYEGVYLELSNVYLEEGRIEAFWRNQTEYAVYFGERYDIQRYVDGEWVSCATRLLDWPMEEYVLENGTQKDMVYDANIEYFDLSEPGTYRIAAQFTVGADDRVCTLWAEFTLCEEGKAYDEESVDSCIRMLADDQQRMRKENRGIAGNTA